jgi:hypothetical protein
MRLPRKSVGRKRLVANPLPNEAGLYQQIQDEKISVHPLIWDTMYHYLGDYVSAINLIAFLSVEKNEPLNIADARKILEYTNRIKDAVDKILHPDKIADAEGLMGRLKNGNMALHPLIKEFFTHYVGNDTYIINMCVSFYLDPLDEQPVPVKDTQKILACTKSMRDFLDKLRQATEQNKGY